MMSEERKTSFSMPQRRPSIHRSLNESSTISKDDEKSPTMNKTQKFVLDDSKDSTIYNSSADYSNEDVQDDETNSEISSATNQNNDDSDYAEEQNIMTKLPANWRLLNRKLLKKEELDPKKFYLLVNPESSYRQKRYIECIHVASKQELRKVVLAPILKEYYVIILLLSALICVVFAASMLSTTENLTNLDVIKEKYPTQEKDLWISFKSGVDDVIMFNRPSSFIFLYTAEANDTLTELLPHLTKYALCKISSCKHEPVIIKDAELNSPKVIRDYGIIIEKYQKPLEKNGVMVIKNFENVVGVSAQAFHSFCDEFTPLVPKSLFIFTLKVRQLPSPGNKMRFIEQYFKDKWIDLKVDILNALITRITSMVIEIHE